jgi:hypothetical protein
MQVQENHTYGFCHCGCGGKTELATRSYLAKDIKRGKPLHYIRGHQNKLHPDTTTRICTNCGLKKDLEDFSVNKNVSIGKGRICKKCNSKAVIYYRNRKYGEPKPSPRNGKLICKDFLYSYLKQHPCCGCTEGDFYVLEFDHVRGVKLASISVIASNMRNIILLRKELPKCDVVCRNCHKLRTLERGHIRTKENVLRPDAKIRRQKCKEWCLDYFSRHPCVDCGMNKPLVMEFDHIKGIKIADVSTLAMRGNLEKMKEEVAKCEPVCGNCHTKRTKKRREIYVY